jgi:predicted transcriptional regulator
VNRYSETVKSHFGLRLKQNVAEKLHSLLELRGGTQNALVNEAIAQYVESQSNKESSEVA